MIASNDAKLASVVCEAAAAVVTCAIRDDILAELGLVEIGSRLELFGGVCVWASLAFHAHTMREKCAHLGFEEDADTLRLALPWIAIPGSSSI